VVFVIAFVVVLTLPPVKPLSAIQLLLRASVYAGPPTFTRIGANVPAGGSRFTVAVAVFVVSAWLVAVTCTTRAADTEIGAVYSPFADSVPTCGFIDHVTPVLLLPVTLAVNCCDCEANSVVVGGVTCTDTAPLCAICIALIFGRSAVPVLN